MRAPRVARFSAPLPHHPLLLPPVCVLLLHHQSEKGSDYRASGREKLRRAPATLAVFPSPEMRAPPHTQARRHRRPAMAPRAGHGMVLKLPKPCDPAASGDAGTVQSRCFDRRAPNPLRPTDSEKASTMKKATTGVEEKASNMEKSFKRHQEKIKPV